MRRAGPLGRAVFLMVLIVATSPRALAALTEPGVLDRIAGTRVALFDPHDPRSEALFEEFLRRYPMINGRRVPPRLAADVLAALAWERAGRSRQQPAYFVIGFLQKAATSPLSEERKRMIRRRYGEDILPQTACPVFASAGGADTAAMLATATGLAQGYFAAAPGEAGGYHQLFLLTELSHCGFMTHVLSEPLFPETEARAFDLRAVVEAVGDLEASAAYRGLMPETQAPDEADVLHAARTVAMFIDGILTPYALIPAVHRLYGDVDALEATRKMDSAREYVRRARRVFREVTGGPGQYPRTPAGLKMMGERVSATLSEGSDAVDAPVEVLLVSFVEAVALLTGGQADAPFLKTQRSELRTLPGLAAVRTGSDIVAGHSQALYFPTLFSQ